MLNPVSLVGGEDDTVSENAGECVNLESMLAYTVNLEIFNVKIFSDTSKNQKIKNTKIPCL